MIFPSCIKFSNENGIVGLRLTQNKRLNRGIKNPGINNLDREQFAKIFFISRRDHDIDKRQITQTRQERFPCFPCFCLIVIAYNALPANWRVNCERNLRV